MQCEDIQDLILTDYLDNQLSKQQKLEFDVHLSKCTQCREFKQTVIKAAVVPFENLKQHRPSDHVWQNVRKNIEGDVASTLESPLADLIDKLKGLINLPKPVYAFAVVLIVGLLTLSILTKNDTGVDLAKTDASIEVDYLASLILEEDSDFTSDENGGYGTAIEEYFL